MNVDAKTIDTIANSSQFGLILLVLAIGGILYLLRMGYLSWSQGKVQVASDGASLAVLQSLRDEVARLNDALDRERKSCAAIIAVMDERLKIMQERITLLEQKLDD